MKPFICTMPMRLDEGWNQIQFNLSDFTRRAYGAAFLDAWFQSSGLGLAAVGSRMLAASSSGYAAVTKFQVFDVSRW